MENTTIQLIAPGVKNTLYYLDETAYFNLLTAILTNEESIDNIIIRGEYADLDWIVHCLEYFEECVPQDFYYIELWLDIEKENEMNITSIVSVCEDSGIAIRWQVTNAADIPLINKIYEKNENYAPFLNFSIVPNKCGYPIEEILTIQSNLRDASITVLATDYATEPELVQKMRSKGICVIDRHSEKFLAYQPNIEVMKEWDWA